MQQSKTLGEMGGATRRLRIPHALSAGRLIVPSSDAGLKSAHFNRPCLAFGLVAPQLLILLFFFFIPSYKALSLAVGQVAPLGGTQIFVGLKNI